MSRSAIGGGRGRRRGGLAQGGQVAPRGSGGTPPPSRRRTCAAPPTASTRAIIVSATTPMAGTAVTSVRSLNDTVDSFETTSTVPRVGPVEGGQRLHRRPGHDRGAGGDAALDAAGVVGVADVAAAEHAGSAPSAPPVERPSGWRRGPREPRRPASSNAVTELHRLDGLDAHEGLGQQGVELAGPSARGSRARPARRRR